MSIWTLPSPSDFQRWEERVLNGEEPSTAARQLTDSNGRPFTCSRFRQADPQRHREILEAGKEARAGYVDERVEIRANDPDAPPAIFLAWARRWNRAYTERQELTGAEGGPVEVNEHRRGLTLDDVARLAAELRSSSEPG